MFRRKSLPLAQQAPVAPAAMTYETNSAPNGN